MFRTRDFILIFAIVFFLVIAIGVTSLKQFLNNPVSSVREFLPSDVLIDKYSAVYENTESSKESAIESLRNKVAKDKSVISMPEPEVATAIIASDEISEQGDEIVAVKTCANYSVFAGVPWVPQDTYWQQEFGMRVLYERPYVETITLATTSSSSVQADIAHLKLPIVSVPNGGSFCLASDVIGVALDGSLIRNSEANLYKVFSSDTIVGYALDGFPIHGQGKEKADSCGGRIVSSQYRYELSSDRDSMINCFSGNPQIFSHGNSSL